MFLPADYVISKFYELGYYPKHNKFNNTYQCSCPICKEGASLGKKKRCYFIPDKDNIFCHNCGWSSKPAKWICEVSGMSTLELIEDIKQNNSNLSIEEHPITLHEKRTVDTLPENCINIFDTAQLEYFKESNILSECIQLIKHRKLDTAINRPDNLYLSLCDKVHKNRLVIPFINEREIIEFYQTRTILQTDKKKPKYLSKINAEKTLFNINKIDPLNENVYIFEGPLNAFFTKNSIAVAGITEGKQTFTHRQQEQFNTVIRFHKKIWVLDSQWCDTASLKKTEILLHQGEKVFLWPEKYGKRFKDFNDIAMYCNINEISESFIQKNTCEGLTGIIKLAEIKKTRHI